MEGSSKSRFMKELRQFALLFSFLWLLLSSFTTFKVIVFGFSSASFMRYGYNILEAAALAKIVLLGKFLGLGERFLDKPLIIPTVYRAFVFTLFVFTFSMLEHFVISFLKGDAYEKIFESFKQQSFYEALGLMPIFFFTFILLFVIFEIAKIFGEDELFDLFFKNRKHKH